MSKYYIGSTFTEKELKLICNALTNMENMKYFDIDNETEEDKKDMIEYNNNCDLSVKLAKKIKGVSTKNSKAELSTALVPKLIYITHIKILKN